MPALIEEIYTFLRQADARELGGMFRALDTARAGLVPRQHECLACHEMREQMQGFDALLDPHEGTCGACHNPHEQETPAAAFESCATSGCHARPDTLTPFHRGIPAAALAKCGDCHVAHEWTMKETTCLSCHGPGGKSQGAIPSLAGLEKAYFVKAMNDFKSGTRPSTIMKRHASGYTDAEFEAMGAYFAGLKK